MLLHQQESAGEMFNAYKSSNTKGIYQRCTSMVTAVDYGLLCTGNIFTALCPMSVTIGVGQYKRHVRGKTQTVATTFHSYNKTYYATEKNAFLLVQVLFGSESVPVDPDV